MQSAECIERYRTMADPKAIGASTGREMRV